MLFTDDAHMARKKERRGVTNHAYTLHVAFFASFRGYMVAIRDASYFFHSILIKGSILANFSFFEKNETFEESMPHSRMTV